MAIEIQEAKRKIDEKIAEMRVGADYLQVASDQLAAVLETQNTERDEALAAKEEALTLVAEKDARIAQLEDHLVANDIEVPTIEEAVDVRPK